MGHGWDAKLSAAYTKIFLHPDAALRHCRVMNHDIEEGRELQLDFTKLKKVAACGQDLVPAVAQDHATGEVLIIGYVNALALETALHERKATFWSTSRNELWIKGKTSGDYLELIEVRVNCEQNSLLYRVRLAGKGSCHTKGQNGQPRLGCYYRKLSADGKKLEFVAGRE